MAFEHPRLLAASLSAALLSTACSTPGDTQPGETGSANPSEQPQTEPHVSESAPSGANPQDPQGLEDRVRSEYTAALVAKYLENAEKLRANGKLEAARRELINAYELNPGNEQVRTQLTAVQAELGEPAGRITKYSEEALRLRQIAEERARSSVTMQLQRAQELVDAKDYAGASEELRVAALQIELKDDMDWKDLPAQVKKARAEAESLYDQQQRAGQAREAEQMADRLRRDYAEAEARRRAQVDSLLQESQVAFESRKFTRSQELSARAMQLEPTNAIAFELHNAAVKAVRNDVNDQYYEQRAKAIRSMMEADEAAKVPQTTILELDVPTWERAKGRSAGRAHEEVTDPQNEAVWNKVHMEQVGKLTYTDETGGYLDVVKNLSLITGVQIITTPEAREIINTENLKVVIGLVSSMTLENFLNHMVGKSQNLAWTVKNGVVVIGNKSQAAGTLRTEIYGVKDLVFKRAQFLPPRIRDIPGEQADDTPRTGSEGDDPVAYVALDVLQTTLKEATDPKYWETEGVQFNIEETGFLTITASPEMHEKVRKVLSHMRRFATPIVTVDSKFLTITRNFLQEVGVDFRGLGGSGNKGTVATLDDVTNGLQSNSSQGLDNGGTGDPAASPLAGFFYNDGRDGDIRGRTENFFANDLGRVLSPTGGLTAGWTFLDDSQINLILRAVEKSANGEVVNSQSLSVLNLGRGHVAVINQTAYVRDFDVEVAQAAFIADPRVDVIQDGVVLDVQPIISHDRKYITLNLNPTVAELTRPIPTFTTSLAGSTLPVTLQLPNLTVTNFTSTVTVPDGGTVLLGGLRQMFTKERRAEVPIFASLPLLSILFKQEGSSDENRSLMVMVKATITDIRD